MVYREIIAVCSQIHTEHINTLCMLQYYMVHVVTTVLWSLYPPQGLS